MIGLCEVAILFLFDVDTVARRRMYGANQVIENQWGGDEDNDDDGDDYNDDDFKCRFFRIFVCFLVFRCIMYECSKVGCRTQSLKKR